MQNIANGDHDERLNRLSEALEKVRAMNGSPDIIQSLIKAIEEVRSSPNR